MDAEGALARSSAPRHPHGARAGASQRGRDVGAAAIVTREAVCLRERRPFAPT